LTPLYFSIPENGSGIKKAIKECKEYKCKECNGLKDKNDPTYEMIEDM